jgi:hypothetical protein
VPNHPNTVITGQAVAKEIYLLFRGELDDGQHALLLIEEKENSHIL